MRLLLIYGVNCTGKIWDGLRPYLGKYEVDYVEYPHEITRKAEQVVDISKWVYDTYKDRSYEAVVGHSLGGIVALQLASRFGMKFQKIIYLDTNLKPANAFYRNLMTSEHMDLYGEKILSMFQQERKFYTSKLLKQLQDDFDYTKELEALKTKIYAVYGDRNLPDYENKTADLNLPEETLDKLEIRFIHNACHMIMIENPKELSLMLEEILGETERSDAGENGCSQKGENE